MVEGVLNALSLSLSKGRSMRRFSGALSLGRCFDEHTHSLTHTHIHETETLKIFQPCVDCDKRAHPLKEGELGEPKYLGYSERLLVSICYIYYHTYFQEC